MVMRDRMTKPPKITREYSTYIFDCDGVLLDSNPIKSEAFYQVALPYGKECAEAFLSYHQKSGGVSRFEKFRHFYEYILNKQTDEAEVQKLIKTFGEIVRQRLLSCKETTGMREFVQALPQSARKIVVSGGMQQELREVFAKRGLDKHFDAIYGSPNTKYEILSKEQQAGLLKMPAVFFGDSRLDYEAASSFELDFIFLSEHTEFQDWQNYFKDKPVCVFKNLSELVPLSCNHE